MKSITRLGIVAFKKTAQTKELLKRIALWAETRNAALLFHPTMTTTSPRRDLIASSEKALIDHSQALVSVGGDGTFLSVARLALSAGIPIIGVNAGTLGFLTDIGPENLEHDLDRILRGSFRLLNRMVLHAHIRRHGSCIKIFHAVNDIFINRTGQSRLTSVSAWWGKDFISEFRADGIIAATPGGSTAYALAAGGPIVEPGVRAFVLAPICPHSLTERPLVLPATRPIRILINPQPARLLVSADGLESQKLIAGDEITISCSSHKTGLIQLAERSYFELLRTRLAWGQSGRSPGER